MTSAQRQAKFRKEMSDKGLVPVTGFVPADQMAAVQIVLRLLRDNPKLEIALLRDSATGKYVKAT